MTRVLSDALLPLGSGPDIVWNGSRGDFAVAPLGEPGNGGGLQARDPLLTAIILCLESDARAEADPLDAQAYDRRGWPGDGFDLRVDLGEAPLGSTVWTAWRRSADDENALSVEDATRIALKPLQSQGVIGEVAVEAVADPARNLIKRIIRISRPDGSLLYSGPYAGLWGAVSPPKGL